MTTRSCVAGAFALALFLLPAGLAQAREAKLRPVACAIIRGAGGGGTGWQIVPGPCPSHIGRARTRRKATHVAARLLHVRALPRPSAPETSRIVAHPAGCPRVAFCGCGAAVRLFGAPIRALWVAANWLRFPRAQPGPDMAAVRPHHVMVILAYHGNGLATVYDANSGGHLTRIHERSLAGFRVVNPRAGSIAAL
jgi:hypothetical protein